MADEPSDAELVSAVLDGHSQRYSQLVQRHQAQLFRHARGMGLDPDTAEDMVQDALVRAFGNLTECRDRARFGLWVGRILRNRCLDHLKSAGTRRNIPLRPDLPNLRDDLERRQETVELQNALEAALDALPTEQREAFTLKHVEGRSYEEMAQMVDVSISAMKMRVHRARDALRRCLDPADVKV